MSNVKKNIPESNWETFCNCMYYYSVGMDNKL